MAGGFAKFVAVVATLGALGAGGYAAYTHVNAERMIGEQHAAAEKCLSALQACTADRDDKSKVADEAAASLDASRTELEELRAERAETEKRLASFKALTEKFQKMIDSGKLQVVFRRGRMVVKLPAGVLFASGSAELSKEGHDAIRDVAKILKQVQDRQFMVAVHTDNLPIDPRAVPPSPFKNNLELSTARALTVAQQLIAAGMNPARLSAAGYAEHEPVRENATDAGRQENRRIEIVLLPNLSEVKDLTLDGGAPEAGARR